MFKKMFKNQRGLTLIELLAVIVILGIIAAIAIPAIGGMISNSKKDAHIANAEAIANSARIYIAEKKLEVPQTIALEKLIENGQIEDIKNPSGKKYNAKTSQVDVSMDGDTKALKFVVTLIQAEGEGDSVTYIDGKDTKNLERKDVKNI